MFQAMRALSRGMALIGGAVLLGLVLMVCLSILGRELGAALPWLGLGPIPGDFELVEAGMAFTIFCFLPLCQIEGGHALVDVFTNQMSARLQRALIWGADMLFAVVLVVIALQLYGGTASKLRSGQTTLILQFPVWWAYAASLLGAIVAALVASYIAAIRSAELASGRAILPSEAEAGH